MEAELAALPNWHVEVTDRGMGRGTWRVVDVEGSVLPKTGQQAVIMAAAPNLLAACEAQHRAIDQLLAWLVLRDPEFMPTQCGQPWAALLEGVAALKKAADLDG